MKIASALASLVVALPLVALQSTTGSISIPETTRFISLSGADFAPGFEVEVYTGGTNPSLGPKLGPPPGTPVSAVAAVQLPHGAKVTRLTARFYDSSTSNFASLTLRRQHLFDNSVSSDMASVSSTGSSGLQTKFDASIADEIVDNENVTYWIDFDAAQPLFGAVQLEGAVIEYTISRPLP